MAKFVDLVPNGDQPVGDGMFVAATVPVAAPRRVADEILDVMKTKPDSEWNVDDVAKALPDKNGPTVRSTMARMVEAKSLVRIGHGRYQIAGAMPQASLLDDEEEIVHEPGREEVKDDDR